MEACDAVARMCDGGGPGPNCDALRTACEGGDMDACAMVEKKVGDTVMVQLPAGVRRLEIKELVTIHQAAAAGGA